MAKTKISESTLRQTKLDCPSRTYRLTPKGLMSLQRSAQENKPWEWSTGPKTKTGKARSKLNAMKHGERTAQRITTRRHLNAALRQLRERDRRSTHSIDNAGQPDDWFERIAVELNASAINMEQYPFPH